jgi:hypothetical protein
MKYRCYLGMRLCEDGFCHSVAPGERLRWKLRCLSILYLS